MAKFCENCGNPIDEGAVFCDNCGARLDGASAGQPMVQQPVQPPAQPPQYIRPASQQAQGNLPYGYPRPPQPPKKSSKLWLVIVIAAVLAAAIVLLVVLLRPKSAKEKPVESTPEPTMSSAVSSKPEEEPVKPTPTPTATPEASPEPVEENLPDFEKYCMVADMKAGEVFDVFTGVRDSDDIMIGKGKLISFIREPVSREIVEFMDGEGADVEGYEVLRLSLVIEYSRALFDSETKTFKGLLTRIVTDYYDMDLYDQSARSLTDSTGEKYYCRDVISGGEKKTMYFWLDTSAELENDILSYHDDRTFLVPAGYDGVVCGYRDVRIDVAHIQDDYSEAKYKLLRLTGGDTPAEAPVAASGSTEEKLPYAGLGAPKDTDFIWIADAQSGVLLGDFIGKDEFIGKWKAEIIFDGVFELMNITIARDGTVTLSPYQINTGDGWIDESKEGPYTLSGQFDYGGAGNIIAAGSYGNLELYQFTEYDGTQYGMGKLTVPSGETGTVYLVRE